MSEAAARELDYLVCGTKPWNRRVFDRILCHYPGRWHYASTTAELIEAVEKIGPRYAFFLHWSDKVPISVLDHCECVCFHMADVPYGRGGSPLQNLILAGHRDTKLTALRMTDQIDAGPVYRKELLTLAGNAEQVYVRSSELAARMIARIIAEEPVPVPQVGDPVVFKRRKPSESEIPSDCDDLESLYDFIRMLDAEGYPKAFITHGRFRFEFTRVGRYDGRLRADVVITEDGAQRR